MKPAWEKGEGRRKSKRGVLGKGICVGNQKKLGENLIHSRAEENNIVRQLFKGLLELPGFKRLKNLKKKELDREIKSKGREKGGRPSKKHRRWQGQGCC